MRRRTKFLIIVLLIAITLEITGYFLIPYDILAMLNITIAIIVTILVIIGIIVIKVNRVIKKTQWYKELFVDFEHEIYPDNVWYRKHNERNYDIVALGSSGAKYAYDFSNTGIKGMNWGQQPQTLIDDFKLLKSFHSILHKKSVVLITIMPFSSCNKETGFMDTFKYIGTFHESKYFDNRFYKKAIRYYRYPILFLKPAIKAFIKYILRKEHSKINQPLVQPMSEKQLKENANQFVKNWKTQIGITDFDVPLTEENKRGREIRLQTMREMLDFIYEREYIPYLIIPPVTEHLSKYFTDKFMETYVYSFIKEINRNIKILDYSKDKELTNDSLYFNSFFLNQNGSKKFTKRVLLDLELIK